MVTTELVPELVLAPAGEKRLLPEAAEGDVEVWHGNDGFEAYGYAAGGHSWAQLPGMGVSRFLADDSGVVAMPDVGVPLERIEDAYHRNVLPLVLQLRGHEVLHASAVSTLSAGRASARSRLFSTRSRLASSAVCCERAGR